MGQKIRSFFRFARDPSVSKRFLLRYALGQLLAYSGAGKYVPFTTRGYRLYLTKSPVAMVQFGDPKREREEERAMRRLAKEGDVVIDIGANVGTFTLAAANAVGRSGRVFAFEAHPRTAAYLARNVRLNALRNVVVTAAALGDRPGTLEFSEERYDDVNHVVEKGTGVPVPVMRLDEVAPLQEVERIRCIKIDVEGYELPVLRGAERTIGKTDYVLFEAFEPNCTRFGYALADLFDWFTERGFALADSVTGEPLNAATTGKKAVANVLAIAATT
jgi:FkbM family methyltransferase